MSKRQHGKSRKRGQSWHKKGNGKRWLRSELPDVGSGADPTEGGPTPARRADRKHGRQRHGDAL